MTPMTIKTEWEDAVKRGTLTVAALKSRFGALSLQVDAAVPVPLSACWPGAEGTATVLWLGNQPDPCFFVRYEEGEAARLGLSRDLAGKPDPREIESTLLVLLAAPRLFVAALSEVSRLTRAVEEAVSASADFFDSPPSEAT